MRNQRARALALAALTALAAACGGDGGPGGIPPDVAPRTTSSGLTYSVLTPGGPGASPRAGDRVAVHFTAWLEGGTVLETSRLGQPATFLLGEQIAGWNEALQLMTPGARYKLTVPPRLGYGAEGRVAQGIPPDATLVFELELVSFERGPAFERPGPEKKKTSSGLVYDVLAPGEGAPAGPDQVVELSFAVWNTSGRLLGYSGFEGAHPKAPIDRFKWGVLREAAGMMPLHARYVFEVPPELAYGAQDFGAALPPNSDTIWQVEILAIRHPLSLPPFELPPAERLSPTPTGLQYEVLAPGKGELPRTGETIELHYAVWRTDGTPLGSSYESGEPLAFEVGERGLHGKELIPAWNECVRLLAPGAVYRFVIPPRLAYGAEGRPPDIGPNETVVYHFERLR